MGAWQVDESLDSDAPTTRISALFADEEEIWTLQETSRFAGTSPKLVVMLSRSISQLEKDERISRLLRSRQ
jgi:hypothetical protein